MTEGDCNGTGAERLRVALDLFATAEALMQQKIRRREPGASPAQIEAEIVAWLLKRPGATIGDAAGRPVPWPRR